MQDPDPFEPFPVRSSERIYDSVWCGLRRDMIDIGKAKLQEYHVFELPDAVSVVPVLPDGSVVMVWQYRYPHGKSHWEVPTGRSHPGEDPVAAAHRELMEETGYATPRLERVAGFYPINGISDHFAHIFIAWDCQLERAPSLDDAERLSVHVVPREEARRKLLGGQFEDAFTGLSLFHYLARAGGPS